MSEHRALVLVLGVIAIYLAAAGRLISAYDALIAPTGGSGGGGSSGFGFKATGTGKGTASGAGDVPNVTPHSTIRTLFGDRRVS